MNRTSVFVIATGVVFLWCSAAVAAEAEDIHAAARAGDLQRVEALLASNASLVDAWSDSGEQPLHVAAGWGQAGVVDLLLAAGADVNAKDRLGRRPLHRAVMGNHLAAMRALLAAGADVNAPDARGETPLHYAARRFRKEAAELLVQAGAEVDARNPLGQTPLDVAAMTGPEAPEVDIRLARVAEVLLAAGADVNARDADGATPLRRALDRNHAKLAGVLRDAGGFATPPLAVPQDRAAYRTYAQIGQFLLDAETNYPSICKRYSLGTSVQGRDIWALLITDNPTAEEDEPEFRYISTMHGDEWVGNEMCLYLIDYLTSNYGSDPRVTNIVDGVELWIVPLMNPDGYVNGPTRYNAHGVDLNRNFPDVYTSPSNTPAGREPETAAIMNWCFGQSFTLAANFHTGSLVANYAFDGNAMDRDVYTAAPDDDFFTWSALEYSQHNLPMWNSPSFEDGITNGARWYVIYGGMQDWSYRWMGANEITVELSNTKIPSASQLPTLWNDNRESMLAYIEACLVGVRGLVTDFETDAPLDAAVTVAGRGHEVYTDPDVGDYHRLLLPGTYELRVEADGYDTVTVSDVAVGSGDATRVDVSTGSPPELTSPNGGETLYTSQAATVAWTGSPSAQFQVQYTDDADAVSSVSDGFEGGGLGPEYRSGGDRSWLVTTSSFHSGSHSARCGDISDDEVSWMTRTIVAQNSVSLSFWYSVSSEANWDWFYFYVDGNEKLRRSGTASWTQFSTTVPAGTHELRWSYFKDGSASSGSDCVWIDDLQMSWSEPPWTDIVALTGPGAMSTQWTPTSTGEGYKVRVRAYYGGGAYGAWDSSDGTFTVEEGATLGDFDGDGDVDLDDFAVFAQCFAGADNPPAAGCPPGVDADLDGDGDVDLDDFAVFAQNFTGSL